MFDGCFPLIVRSVQKTITKKNTGKCRVQNRTVLYQPTSYSSRLSLLSILLISRKCYPKTKIEKPNATHPKGPRSISTAFKWADAFLTRLCVQFGRDVVERKLRRWRWDMTTCFSGIGCPEAVPSSFATHTSKNEKGQCPLPTFPATVIPRLSSAWSSLPRTSLDLLREDITLRCFLHVNATDIAKKS